MIGLLSLPVKAILIRALLMHDARPSYAGMIQELKDPSTSAERLEQIANIENSEYSTVLLINHPNVSDKVAVQLFNSWADQPYVNQLIRAIASCPNLSVASIEQLVDKYWDAPTVGALAANPNITQELLGKLASSPYEETRQHVAESRRTLAPILEKLSQDSWWMIRGGVAANQNAPVSVLENLSQDKSAFIRAYVAGNLSTPVEILSQIATDFHHEPKQAAASNPRLPLIDCTKLLKDENLKVREAAKVTFISYPEDLYKEQGQSIMVAGVPLSTLPKNWAIKLLEEGN